jgi:hypothetical protein
MMLTTDLGFLDLYDYIPGFPDMPVADVFSDSIELDNLRFVSLRWLRKLKQAAGRHKDLDDLEHLPSSWPPHDRDGSSRSVRAHTLLGSVARAGGPISRLRRAGVGDNGGGGWRRRVKGVMLRALLVSSGSTGEPVHARRFEDC